MDTYDAYSEFERKQRRTSFIVKTCALIGLLLVVCSAMAIYFSVKSKPVDKPYERGQSFVENAKSLESEDSPAKELLDLIKLKMEYAYFEGQKDALNGDFRIKKTYEGVYVWVSSCWDESLDPMLYDPSEEEE